MLRLGSPPNQSREMDIDDIFLARLAMMVMMADAYLDGLPLGEKRRHAMFENAHRVESECAELGNLICGRQHSVVRGSGKIEFDSAFCQKAKLLAVMIKAIVRGFTMNDKFKAAMRANLADIRRRMALHPMDWHF